MKRNPMGTKSGRRKKGGSGCLGTILLLVLILLGAALYCSSEGRLQKAYIGIAKFENRIKGIDGISGASVEKVKGDASRHSAAIRSLLRIDSKTEDDSLPSSLQ